eukprot:6664986-Lingulodinium_polyedra.AAC.1
MTWANRACNCDATAATATARCMAPSWFTMFGVANRKVSVDESESLSHGGGVTPSSRQHLRLEDEAAGERASPGRATAG